MVKRLCNRKPDVEMLGFQYFDEPVKVLSLADAVVDFYRARKGGSADDIDDSFARMLAIRHRVFDEPLPLIVDIFLFGFDYNTGWKPAGLISYIKTLSDEELSTVTNRVVVDKSIYSSESFYKALKDLEIDFFPKTRIYKLAKLMDGAKITQERISKEFEISIDGVKGFFRNRQYAAKHIRLYNHTVNLMHGENKSSSKYLKEVVLPLGSNISSGDIESYLNSDYRLRSGLLSHKIINNIRKDLIMHCK